MFKQVVRNVIVSIITWEAAGVLKKYAPRIIAVTGSVGKTSTKDAIYALLSARGFVRKSEKSFNSDIGVPLTILGRPTGWDNPFVWLSNIVSGLFLLVVPHRYPEWLVLEVGADRPGDIEKISRWLRPDIVVVTRFAPVPVHVEFFGSSEKVIMEKTWLVKALKDQGVLVLSQDDPDVLALKDSVRRKVVTFGFSRDADVFGMKDVVLYEGRKYKHPVGMRFQLECLEVRGEVSLNGFVGRQMIYAGLAAAGVGVALGMSVKEITEGVSRFESPNGRMKIIEGVKHSVILDDSYNSSPVAVREALDALASLSEKGKKIAVLADMLELGRFSVAEHKAVGEYAASRVDMLLTVGVRARDCVDGALNAEMDESNILQFDDAFRAGKALEALINEGDVVLVKGSQGMRMERVVEEIMAHPEQKEKFLVRQEKEWKLR